MEASFSRLQQNLHVQTRKLASSGPQKKLPNVQRQRRPRRSEAARGSPGSASEGLDPRKPAARPGSARGRVLAANAEDRGGKARERGAYSALAGLAGWARGAGWAAKARGGCPGRRPQPRRALGPRLPPPAPRWRRGPRGSPAREARGGRKGSRDKKKKGQPTERGGPAYFFFSFSPPAPSMAKRCPRCLPGRRPPGSLRPKRRLCPHAQRKEQVQRRGARRDAPRDGEAGAAGCARRAPAPVPSCSSGWLVKAWPDTARDGSKDSPRVPSDEEALCTEALRQRQGAGKGGGALGRAARGGDRRSARARSARRARPRARLT